MAQLCPTEEPRGPRSQNCGSTNHQQYSSRTGNIYLDGQDISQNVLLLCRRLLIFDQGTQLTELAESKRLHKLAHLFPGLHRPLHKPLKANPNERCSLWRYQLSPQHSYSAQLLLRNLFSQPHFICSSYTDSSVIKK
jgi:hypothetical protein